MVVSTDPQREQVLKLIGEKEKVEKKIADLGLVLQTNKIGFDEPLVDAEGFPRGDIDVRSVRLARTQIICLQNDLKELTKSIESGLEKYFHESKETLTSTKIPPEIRNASPDPSTSTSHSTEINQTPIVVVNLVSPGSPAEDAGIQVRDKILAFGTITSLNFKDLAQIGDLVKNSQNQQVRVKVNRDNKMEELILVPKIWSGRGFLGCNIVPYSSI
ncbi:CLUMA_CG018979, isoform A [Clunio marinus]|uniref:26S proteasome non-ATPase regulatory subunit 9 n=1 Tax=Clunio marinus TaxID=568069 RepID=A0A1J1J0M4_9DIPT|nr:CLUMA_CG018979, isoform A [Clunio marinus]